LPFLPRFAGYYLEGLKKLKIFRPKGYKKAFFNGYYLRGNFVKENHVLKMST